VKKTTVDSSKLLFFNCNFSFNRLKHWTCYKLRMFFNKNLLSCLSPSEPDSRSIWVAVWGPPNATFRSNGMAPTKPGKVEHEPVPLVPFCGFWIWHIRSYSSTFYKEFFTKNLSVVVYLCFLNARYKLQEFSRTEFQKMRILLLKII